VSGQGLDPSLEDLSPASVDAKSSRCLIACATLDSPRTTAEALARLHALSTAVDVDELCSLGEAYGLEILDIAWPDAFLMWSRGRDGVHPLSWAHRRLTAHRRAPLKQALGSPVHRRELESLLRYGAWRLDGTVRMGLLRGARTQFARDLVAVADEALADGPEALPPGGAPAEVWRTWSETLGLSAWLSLKTWMLAGPVNTAARSFLTARGDQTVVKTLAGKPFRAEQGWRKSYASVPSAIQSLLRKRLRTAARHALFARSPVPVEAPDPARPHIAALVERLRSMKAGDAEILGPTWALEPPDLDVEIVFDPPAARLWERRDGRTEVPAVELSLTAPLRRWGGSWREEATDPLRQRAVDAVIDALLHPPEPELLDRLEGDLAVPAWKRLLAELDEEAARDWQLGWSLRPIDHGWKLVPLRCTANKSGGWTTKMVKLRDLHDAPEALGADDRRALSALTLADDDSAYRSAASQANPLRIARALLALRHHPRLFLRHGRERPLQVSLSELSIQWTEPPGGGLHVDVKLDGEGLRDEDLDRLARHHAPEPAMLVDPDRDRVTLVELSGSMPRLLRALRRRGHAFGADAVEPMLGALARFEEAAPVSLSSELAGAERPTDERLHLRLERRADGLLVRAWVRPITGGRLLLPGRGAPAAYGADGEGRFHVLRDLTAERMQVRRLGEELGLPPPTGDGTLGWVLEEMEAAGGVLSSLRERDDLVIEWEGRSTQLRKTGGLGRLSLRFQDLQTWFGVSGSLKLGKRSVGLTTLLEAAEQGRRFVALDDNDWVELDDELSGALREAAATLQWEGDELRANPLHAPLLKALTDGAEVDAPTSWSSRSDAIDAAAEMLPEVPSNLQGELRDYQTEGFQWLARLATWAGGACLADDMGLGKTIQALALLLRRAKDGPALVVAPASVAFNWLRETARFAPSLNVVDLRGPKRSLGTPGPGDLIVTTWGVLPRDLPAISEVKWSTLVLDEAHAIKNARAVRHRAASGVPADFRLALTGTPVENHAGELHALYSVLLPGLLGSPEQFHTRFTKPIGEGLLERRDLLARLVRPFLLRRLKSEVAADLPARTEIRLDIDLSEDERVAYERQRQAGLAQLTLASDPTEAHRRFAALAAIGRLRQAACHPRLIAPESTVPSSKVRKLLRVLSDLRAEGHQALVFSQYVRLLNLVEDDLKERGFRLARLDGSTPARRRQEEVDRFQASGADVFLISLKAGGVGLNLTAASYVFHLDPWWNPAAEDQATDRAHRIGQTLPVTVYRLVARGTVEESILRLHGAKRELVHGLLSGSEHAAPLSSTELIDLLSGADPRGTSAPKPPPAAARA